MARYIGPKNRLSRREGFDLFNKAGKLRRANVKPGQKSSSRINKKTSEYGIQLRAKQKAKRFYGIFEKQFQNYVFKATRSKGKAGEALICLLEKRLDNVVFRLGLAPTRAAARQYVNHGHVLLNGEVMSIPSHETKTGDVITLSKTIQDIPPVKELLEEEKPRIPDWLERNGSSGKLTREPTLLDVKEPISVIDIIEFYSR